MPAINICKISNQVFFFSKDMYFPNVLRNRDTFLLLRDSLCGFFAQEI